MTSRAEADDELEVKMEVKDEFREAIDTTNCEETATSDGQPLEFHEAILPPNLQLRCRLCAIPDHDTVDIFNPDETNKNILEKIEYCLPIVVKETDTMPTQACRLCLAHLELSYQFHKTVAEAERQLLALDRQMFGRCTKIEENFQTYDPSDCVNIGESLEAIAEVETSDNLSTTGFEKVETTFTTENENVDSEGFQLCSVDEIGVSFETIAEIENSDNLSTTAFEKVETAYTTEKANVVVFVTESHDVNDSDTETRRSRSNDTKHQNVVPFHPGSTSASKIDQQSTCGSEAPKEDGNRSIADEANLANHLQWHADNNWQCKDCGKTFKSARNLRGHSRACRPDQAVKNRSSARILKTKQVLAQQKNVHTRDEIFSCEYCGKKFSSKKTRDYHRRTHTKEGSFKCSVCNKMFITDSKLKRHSTVHSEERHYRCSLCDKTFKSLDAKRKHMASHADGRLWQCDYCNNSFLRKLALRDHSRICEERYPKKLR